MSGFAHLYLVIGHSTWYERWEMTAVSNSAMFRLAETSGTSNWSGASYMFILATNNTWSGNKSEGVSGGSATIKGWGGVLGSTADYNPGNIASGSASGQTIYLKTSAAATTTLTHNAIGSATGDQYSTLKGGNNYVTYKTQVASAGANPTYSNSTATGIATITLTTGYWGSATSVTLSDASSSAGSTSYNNPALAAQSTLAYSSMGASYEFKGFYQGTTSNGGTMTTLATSGTSVTVYPQTYTGTAQQYQYYFARFQKKPLLSFGQDVAGTVTIGGNAAAATQYVSSATDIAVDISAPDGYTIAEVSGANWSATDTTSSTHWTGTINITSDDTLTVTYSEIRDSSIALTAFTNGQDSDDGGKIKVGGYNRIYIPSGDVGVDTYVTAVSAVTSADYVFTGWQFDGSNYNHIRYKLNAGDAWSTPSAQNTTVGTSSDTTIYIKTDGTSGLTTADAIVKAMFVTGNRTVTTTPLLATNDTGYTNGNDGGAFSATLTGAGTYAAAVNPASVTLTADEPAGYKFVGWYVSDSDSVGSSTPLALSTAIQGTSGIYTYTAGTKTLSFTMDTTCDLHYYALYKKIYYITVYDSYHYDVDPTTGAKSNFVFKTSPPRTVTATNAQGTTTFTYAAGNITQRGEDNYGNGSGTGPNANTGAAAHIVESGTFYEGNQLAVLAGDEIVMTYSTLSSSDAISGVFFNNSIRYTTELEYDNLYTNRVYQGYHTTVNGAETGTGEDDKWNYTYAQQTTLYADPDYFRSETVPGTETLVTAAIASATANNNPYRATVDQDAHTVTFTVTQDYRNIDITLASKRQIVFSDTANVKINSINSDNYYSVADDISTGETAATRLAVYAKGNADQKTTITLANVKFYYYNAEKGWFTDASGAKLADQTQPVELTGADNTITKNISAGTSITNNYTSSDSSAYIYFGGTMPNTDVYVELNVNVVYKMYIGSKIVSDTVASKTYLAQVATVTATYTSPSSTSHTAGTSAVYNSTSKECTAGSQVTYTIVWGTDSGSGKKWDNFYMFSGWYLGDSSGPKYEDKYYLGNDVTLRYTPKKNSYVYAVGTRDVFINGSKYITGAANDWNRTGSNAPVNFKMEFDADYVNPENQKRGRYYWEIDTAKYTGASSNYAEGATTSYTVDDVTCYRWNSDSSMGNSWFQFMDEATGWNKSLWDDLKSFQNNVHAGVHYGKAFKANTTTNSSYDKQEGCGWINFSESRYQGWSTPLRIYYYPGADGFSVEATPIWPHIYVSNGYKGIDTANDGTPSNVTVTVDGASTLVAAGSNTWSSLSCEGTVKEYYIKKKNADVKLTKTVNAGYKVSYFFTYNLKTEEVKAYAATAESTDNTYSATVKMNNDEGMYICPIVESTSADMTVMFDASQLDYDEWGKFVSCYAWYSNDGESGAKKAYGPYPGQLMIPFDGGLSWQAKFPSKNDNATLVGITFANYVDGSNTWLGGSGVMGTATYTTSNNTTTASLGTGGLINKYNHVGDGNYERYNSKVQTYDYREPIAFNNNSNAEQKLITFAVKSGNGNLIAWNYNDLTTENIKSHIGAASWPLDFEYLVDIKGKYVDLNGKSMDDKPTPSFYVCAKGMVTYTDNSMTRQFVGGNQADSYYTADTVTYSDAYGAGSVSMNYAVQWYIYDASGKYIDTVLSAGYADKSAEDVGVTTGLDSDVIQKAIDDARAQIGVKLENAGYAVSGRSVAICYDEPRYCYNTASYANGGTTFDAYRLTGQWLQQSEYETAQVSVEVGLRYAGDVTMSGLSSTDYGSANVTVDKSALSHKEYGLTGIDEKTGLKYGQVTIVEGNRKALTITADSTNFEGWYYYDGDGELVLASKDASYTPGVSKDITYYGIYAAKATYKLNYTGREGGTKSYSVSGGDMTAAEIGNSNTVSTSRTDFDTSFGGAVISIFKKTINIGTHSALDNTTARTLQATLNNITDQTFTLTYYYPDTQGGDNAAHAAGTTDIAYNTVANLPNDQSAAVTANAPDNMVFKGWYTAAEGGQLLSIYPNYGMRIVKNTTVYAQYAAAKYTAGEVSDWNVYIDDHEITKEKTSTTNGTYYNDTIIRVSGDNNINAAIPDDAEAGILLIKSGKDSSFVTDSKTETQLKSYINNAKLTNGKTAKITSGGATVTKMCVTGEDNVLTMYNRANFCVRSDYAATIGQTYSVYAYVKIDAEHIYLSAPYGITNAVAGAVGTYN